jgi:Tat protein translocase TatB subunit
MFGIGFAELVLVLVVALLVVGPDKLPGLARSIAKGYNQLRRAGNDIKRSVTDIDLGSTLAGLDDEQRHATGAERAKGAKPARGEGSAKSAKSAGPGKRKGDANGHG